jgi:glycosyltransferase involved in cell wall biosynthesis
MGALRLAAMGLRIAFDYTAAASHWPGVGRYGRELVRALVRLDACPELVLFECGRPGPLPTAALGLDTDMARERVRRIVLPGRERVRTWKARWLRRGIERALGPVDLVHRAQLERPPVFGLPCVLPLFELPAGGPTVSFDALKHLVVGSAAGRQVVLNELGLDPARISAVRTGADHWLRDVAPAQERDAEWAARAAAPHTLVVLGALRHARRTLDILAGFEALYATRQDVRLAFDGRAGDAAEAFQAALATSPARAAVTWNPAPNEQALPTLVSNASVLVHLSQGELSPVTPLEALHFGTAVVASDLPAFREALPASALVTPQTERDPQALAAAMARAIDIADDPEARRARRELAAPYTWAACAQDHIALWQRLAQANA